MFFPLLQRAAESGKGEYLFFYLLKIISCIIICLKKKRQRQFLGVKIKKQINTENVFVYFNLVYQGHKIILKMICCW